MSDLFLDPPARDEDAPPPATSRRARRDDREARARRRRDRRRRATTVLALVALLLGGVGFVLWSVFGDLFTGGDDAAATVSDYPGPGSGQIQVTVAAGDTGQVIGQTLVEAGVVATVDAFAAAYDANPQATSIQPGTYALRQRMRAVDAVDALLDQENRVSVRVTIPEGWTAAQVYDKVYEVTTIPVDELAAAAQDPAALGVPVEAGSIEGWLAPATYEVDPGATAAEVLGRMVARTVQDLTARGVAPEQMQRVLTVASVVEREAKRDEDRPKIARAIENRLADGMPLQVDATVLYGIGVTGRGPTGDELADAGNAYNTYEHTGLPPTPIGGPGAASLDAALAPAEGDWLYWVTVNFDTGETRFAATYPDHLENKAVMEEWLAANGY
ncbi:endolytic transglycosylase MltG [Cellulomonas denverensis]|uniref:endolytic transglycosylase MltG n=1 Tax=Cellulomonas denverensis TaxID=264297 RepID=UPI001A4E71BE|nr:endolytic transglycosylase MltG [Cellulomonas denverensis]GIG24248.1 ABC transporter substrate-binding protein [Cellulomonas denverensis]